MNINNNNLKELNLLKKKIIAEYEEKQQKLINLLEDVSSLTEEEAKKIIIDQIEEKYQGILVKKTKELKNKTENEIEKISQKIIATAIERYASKYVGSKTIIKMNLGDSKLKGKIIGKEGRNIRTFEDKSGVDIVMEKDSNVIKFSCFNPIRREIAHRAMKKLIEDGRIQPQKIEHFLETEKKNINLIIQETGKRVANDLNIFDLSDEIIKNLGILKYRTSYAQNVLEHSIEVAKIAGAMAEELGLNSKIAVRAGLLHDIGKAQDFIIEKTHVQLGVEIAQKFQESDIIVNAIASHHGDVPPTNVYSLLVSAADTISAAREGARDNVQEDYLKRMKTIEDICKKIPGIKESYAVKSGRIIRVFVDSKKINDYESEKIADLIAEKIKKNLKIPGEVIIKVIREFEVERKI